VAEPRGKIRIRGRHTQATSGFVKLAVRASSSSRLDRHRTAALLRDVVGSAERDRRGELDVDVLPLEIDGRRAQPAMRR